MSVALCLIALSLGYLVLSRLPMRGGFEDPWAIHRGDRCDHFDFVGSLFGLVALWVINKPGGAKK